MPLRSRFTAQRPLPYSSEPIGLHAERLVAARELPTERLLKAPIVRATPELGRTYSNRRLRRATIPTPSSTPDAGEGIVEVHTKASA